MSIGATLLVGATLTTGTTASKACLIQSRRFQIDFDLNCSAGPSTVTYWIEYSEDLVNWFRETAEEDGGKGVVLMPKALRTLTDNNSTTIANNPNFRVSIQYVRKAQFARLQMSATAGTVIVNSIQAPFDLGPYGDVVTVASPTPPPPSCDTGTVAFNHNFAETDIATNPPSPFVQTCRSFAIDGTTICGASAPDGKLAFDITSGEINYDEIGGVDVIVGLTPLDPLEGTVVYSSDTNPTGAAWINIALRPNEVTNTFNNPNPAGTFYLKVTATPGAGLLAGIRNWVGRITVL